MKSNDKLKAEARNTLAEDCTQYGGDENEPTKLRTDQVVNSLDDLIDQTITETIKHCAEVVGDNYEHICRFNDGDCACECMTMTKKQAQQRLLDLIK